jgi:hypothetical protein
MNWSDLSRLEKVAPEDDPMVRYHQRLNHGPFPCNRRVVVVVDTPRHRRAVRFRPEVALAALTR